MDNGTLSIKSARSQLEKLLRFSRLADSVRIKRAWNKLKLADLPGSTVLEEPAAASVKKLLEQAGKASERSLMPFAEKLKGAILEKWQNAEISFHETRGLDSFYAERGGIIIAYK